MESTWSVAFNNSTGHFRFSTLAMMIMERKNCLTARIAPIVENLDFLECRMGLVGQACEAGISHPGRVSQVQVSVLLLEPESDAACFCISRLQVQSDEHVSPTSSVLGRRLEYWTACKTSFSFLWHP